MMSDNGKKPVERKLAIVGFADSRNLAPYDDPSWEIWGVNDVYAHVPRVDVVFEVHHLLNLGNRRNPNHENFLRSGQKPVWLIEDKPEYPSSKRLPVEDVIKRFPRSYITNSISWMLALAIMDIEGSASWIERNEPLPGKLHIFGVDMAHPSEFVKDNERGYAGQRPSCEYFVGIAEGAGIEVYIPDNSDLCKTTGLYGLHTTSPLRIKIQSREEHLRQAKVQFMQQQAQLQGQIQGIQSQIDQVRGQMAALEYIKGVWTHETDIPIGAEMPLKDRGLPMPGSPLDEGFTFPYQPFEAPQPNPVLEDLTKEKTVG